MDTLIHIGYPKTATTWFQEEFFPKVENCNFFSHKITYNKIFKGNNNINELKMFFNNKENQKTIISEELLSGIINFQMQEKTRIKDIAHKLKSVFTDARILLLVRKQTDFILSGYIQYIKNGGTFRFKNYIEYFSKKVVNEFNTIESLKIINYNDLLNIYSEVFGQENIDVFLYEEFTENNKNFTDKIIKHYNLKIDIANVNYRNRNQIMRKGLKKMVRASNYLHKGKMDYKTYYINLPLLMGAKVKYINKINNFNIFGRRIRLDDIIENKTIKKLKDIYSIQNKKLQEYIPIEKLKKYNYI